MSKLSLKVGAFLAGVVALFGATAVKAAADADLSAAIASSTAILTDNRNQLVLWLVAIFGFVFIITMVKVLLSYIRRQAAGAVGGGGRRRR